MDELTEQMGMLEGIDFDDTPDVVVPVAPVQPVAQQVPVQQPVQNPAQSFAQAQVVQPTLTATVQQPVAQQPVLDMNAAPTFVSLGESTYQTKTDFLKLKEGESTRVTLINYNAVSTHFHYENGLGYFKCLSEYPVNSDWPTIKEICCLQPSPYDSTKLVGHGKTKIFLPVIEYPVSHVDGKGIIPNAQPALRVLALNKAEYDTLLEVQSNYGMDTSTFDLAVSRKKDASGYLRTTLTAIPSARAQYAAAIATETAKLTNETYNLAREEFAKTLSKESIQKFYTDRAEQKKMADNLNSAADTMQIPTTPGSLI